MIEQRFTGFQRFVQAAEQSQELTQLSHLDDFQLLASIIQTGLVGQRVVRKLHAGQVDFRIERLTNDDGDQSRAVRFDRQLHDIEHRLCAFNQLFRFKEILRRFLIDFRTRAVLPLLGLCQSFFKVANGGEESIESLAIVWADILLESLHFIADRVHQALAFA